MQTFQRQAAQIREWDEQIRENMGTANQIVQDAAAVVQMQSGLDSNLARIEAQQQELEALLKTVEESIERAEKEFPPIGPYNQDRETGYSLAVGVCEQLDSMSRELLDIVAKVNGSEGERDKDGFGAQVIATLNSQTNALQWAEKTVQELKHRVDGIEKSLSQQPR